MQDCVTQRRLCFLCSVIVSVSQEDRTGYLNVNKHEKDTCDNTSGISPQERAVFHEAIDPDFCVLCKTVLPVDIFPLTLCFY